MGVTKTWALMLCNLYVRDGVAYVPTAATTEAGYYLEIEPVEVAHLSDRIALKAAVMRAIERGHPRVPTPTRENFPKPIILKYAGVKALRTFEKTASCWQFLMSNGLYQIEQWRPFPKGGWVPNGAKIESLPASTSLDDAVDRFAERLCLGWPAA